jgi:hypothetical protein
MQLVLTYQLQADPTVAEMALIRSMPGLTVLDEFPGTVLVDWAGALATLQAIFPNWRVAPPATLGPC